MITNIINNININETIRSDLVFSDSTKIRLNTENKRDPRIQLKENNVTGFFPLDNDIFVELPFIEPNRLRKWLRFEAITNVADNPSALTVQFKVKTTSGNFFYDGANWVAAGLSDWNTQQEISDNISTFPISTIGNKKISFVVNLKTTDKNSTPVLREIKLAGEYQIEFFEDIVYDSIMRKLNTEFQSTSIISLQSVGQSSVDLGTTLENQSYNITGIESVYNVTDDSLRVNNLFDSYVQGSQKQDGFTFEPGVVNFSSSIDSGDVIEITFKYLPEFIIKTSQDFFEVPSYPSVVFEQIEEVRRVGHFIKDTNSIGRDSVRDFALNDALVQESPSQKTFRFNWAAFTNLQLDQMRLTRDLNAFWAKNKTIKSWGLDIDYDVIINEEFDSKENSKTNDNTDTNVATGSFDILGVLFYDKDSKIEQLVSQMNIETS